MTKRMRPAAALAAALVLVSIVSGCAVFTVVNRGERVPIGEKFSIDPQRMWSQLSKDRVKLWTVDGPLLDTVVLYEGIEDGQPLGSALPANQAKDLPLFEKEMTALEVRDLWVATLARRASLAVEISDLRPWSFGGTDGFRFAHRYRTKDGLDMRGFAVGTIVNGKLYLIVYTAAALYYYDAYSRDVERMVGSITKS